MHHTVAFIDGLGGPELFLILILCLLLFGGKRMPDLARAFGRAIREFKRAASGVEDEIKRAIDEAPSTNSTPPPASSVKKPAPPKTVSTDSSEHAAE